MTVKQISIFLENKPGQLAGICRTLAKAEINIATLSRADTADFGIVRMIVDDHVKGVEVLAKASPLLERFGGHPMAVGIGLKADRIADFFEVMEAEIRRQLTVDQLKNYLPYDGELVISDLTPEVFRHLGALAPFGHSNTKPVFRFNDVEFPRIHPAGESHARGVVRDATGQIEFIAFNRSPAALRGHRFDILATPQVNTRYNAESTQLNIIDLKEID